MEKAKKVIIERLIFNLNDWISTGSNASADYFYEDLELLFRLGVINRKQFDEIASGYFSDNVSEVQGILLEYAI